LASGRAGLIEHAANFVTRGPAVAQIVGRVEPECYDEGVNDVHAGSILYRCLLRHTLVVPVYLRDLKQIQHTFKTVHGLQFV
jgi:hypothetical protein